MRRWCEGVLSTAAAISFPGSYRQSPHDPLAVGLPVDEVVPDPSPVDIVGCLKVLEGLSRLLEFLAALRTGEHIL